MSSVQLNLPDLRGQEPEDAKQHLRAIIRQAREKRSRADLAVLNEVIIKTALDLAEDAKTVAFYVSVNEEPPTHEAIEALYQAGKQVLLPKLGPKLSRFWAYYKGAEDLDFRAPERPMEPSGPALESEELAKVDLVITPALAVDRQGNRLGQGGGWYDRALIHCRPETPVFALCYTEELIGGTLLPHTDLDVPVTGVFTPDVCFALEDSIFQQTGQLSL